MVWVFFNEKRQETQGNIMVWMFFDGKKTGNSRKYNGLGVFLMEKGQETQGNIMVWVFLDVFVSWAVCTMFFFS